MGWYSGDEDHGDADGVFGYDDDYDFDELYDIMNDGIAILDECGCSVEPDGVCYHGNESPLLRLGLI